MNVPEIGPSITCEVMIFNKKCINIFSIHIDSYQIQFITEFLEIKKANIPY